MIRKLFIASLFLSVIFIIPTRVSAAEFKSGDDMTISKNQVVDGALFIAGKNLRIDGRIKGELYCAGNNIEISGTIDGDVYCAGQNITVSGVVNGDVKIAGETTTVDGIIKGNVMSFGKSNTFSSKSSVERDVITAGQTIVLQGTIARDLNVNGNTISMGGIVGRDVTANGKDISVSNSAAIKRNFSYESTSNANVAPSQVGGTIVHKTPEKPQKEKAEQSQSVVMDWITNLIYKILSSLLIAFLFIALFGSRVKDIATQMRSKPLASIGWGLMYLIIAPVLILLIFITVIGIPVGLIMTFVYIATLMAATTVFALMIGQFLTQKYFPDHSESLWYIVSLGVIATAILFKIPFIGGLATITAFLWGLGGIFNYIRTSMRA